MRRFTLLLISLALTLAACGGSSSSTTSDDVDVPETSSTGAAGAGTVDATDEQPGNTEEPTGTTEGGSAPAAGPEPTDFDGPVAADFTIELNKTGTFTLSGEARPVYLVFWAEW